MSEDTDDWRGSDENHELIVPPEITQEIFLQWRSPRFGTTNPQQLSNPLWAWLIYSKWSAYTINEHFEGPSPFDAGPGWSWRRFGQSKTVLPDGRTIFIAVNMKIIMTPISLFIMM